MNFVIHNYRAYADLFDLTVMISVSDVSTDPTKSFCGSVWTGEVHIGFLLCAPLVIDPSVIELVFILLGVCLYL